MPDGMDPNVWNALTPEQKTEALGEEYVPPTEGTPGTPGLLAGPGEFEESPGYQFVKSEGQNAITNSLSARGKVDSGQGAKEAGRYATGLASQEYGNFWNRYQDKIRGYQSVAGIGQNTANNTAANAMATGANVGGAQAAGIYNSTAASNAGITGAATAVNRGIENYLTYRASPYA